MRIAYLENRLTQAGATFIRHEMNAVVARGHEVLPFSVRMPSEKDRLLSEPNMPAPTTYLLAGGPLAVLKGVLPEMAMHPWRVARAARLVAGTSAAGAYGRARTLVQFAAGVRLARRLRQEGVDHLHNHALHSAPVALVASTVARIPYSLTTHGPPEYDAPGEPHLEVHARHAGFIAAVTHVVRGEVCRLIPPRYWPGVKVVHCGLPDHQLRSAGGPPPDVPVLVCVARLDERKGQPLLLDAAERLVTQGHDVRIVLVGDGPLRRELEHRIERGALQGRVRITGWQPSEVVWDELLAARAMVLPSFAEGLPVAIMEALAAGRPVVASSVGAVAELVRPGETGWLVSPTDVGQLTTAMREVLRASPDRLEDMGRRGADLVRERHRAVDEADRLLGHIENLRRR